MSQSSYPPRWAHASNVSPESSWDLLEAGLSKSGEDLPMFGTSSKIDRQEPNERHHFEARYLSRGDTAMSREPCARRAICFASRGALRIAVKRHIRPNQSQTPEMFAESFPKFGAAPPTADNLDCPLQSGLSNLRALWHCTDRSRLHFELTNRVVEKSICLPLDNGILFHRGNSSSERSEQLHV